MTLATSTAGLLIATGGQPSPVPFLICTSAHAGADVLVNALRQWGIDVADDPSALRAPLTHEAQQNGRAKHPAPGQDPALGQDPGPRQDPDPGLAGRLAEHLVNGEAAPAGRAVVLNWSDFSPLVRRPEPAPAGGESRGGQPARPQWHSALDPLVPGLRYVHLVRRDKVAQDEAAQGQGARPGGETERLARLRMDDWNWIGFFTWARIQTLTISYESLLADRATTVGRLLTLLGLEPLSPVELDLGPLPADGSVPDMVRAGTTDVRGSTSRRTSRPPVSVVVVSHNEGQKLALTVDGIRATVPDAVEVIVVDDCSSDDSVAALQPGSAQVVRTEARGGVTGARNAGAARATGDVLVFADAHVDPSPGWLDGLCDALADRDVGCAAPTITQIHERSAAGHGFTWREPQLRMGWLRSPRTDPHEVPFLCGCLMAFRRSDFEAVGGFDPGMLRWGSEDAEICLHLRRRGLASVVVPSARVAHLFRPTSPYDVPPHLVVHNALRMAVTHLPTSAVRGVIAAYAGLPTFPAAYAQLVEGDVWQRRQWVNEHAGHDGAWFLDYFRISALR